MAKGRTHPISPLTKWIISYLTYSGGKKETSRLCVTHERNSQRSKIAIFQKKHIFFEEIFKSGEKAIFKRKNLREKEANEERRKFETPGNWEMSSTTDRKKLVVVGDGGKGSKLNSIFKFCRPKLMVKLLKRALNCRFFFLEKALLTFYDSSVVILTIILVRLFRIFIYYFV